MQSIKCKVVFVFSIVKNFGKFYFFDHYKLGVKYVAKTQLAWQ